MRIFHRPIEMYTHATGWENIDPDSAPTVITRPVGGGAAIETLTAVRYVTGYWYIDTSGALYVANVTYEMVWTVTISGDSGDAPPEYFRHVVPAVTDTTPPGAAGISVASIGDTSITVYHVPPTDADYDHTTVFAGVVPGDGTAPVVASGSGSTIEITGLKPGYSYWLSAVAYDTSGNPSAIGASSIVSATTWPAELPEFPMFIKCFVDGEPVPRRVFAIDPTRVDANSAGATNHELRPNIRGRIHRIRIECHAPVANLQTRGLTMLLQLRDRGEPGGLKDSFGN